MGITIDDNKSRDEICVTLDDRSEGGTFYSEIVMANENDSKIVLDRWFEWRDSPKSNTITSGGNILYSYGDVLERFISARNARVSMPFPQLDLFGKCNFDSYAVFGIPVDVTCKYKITSLAECTTILNPSTYAGFTISKYRNSTETVTPTIASGSTSPVVSTGAD